MAKQTRDVLKTYFEDGDTPDQIEFGELIDSQVNLEDTGEQIVKGTLSASAVGADAYFLKGFAFEQVEISDIKLTGSNIFGSGGAAPTGVTSHSFFGPIYQSSSGADSASYFLTPVIIGGTETNLEGEGLHINVTKTIASQGNPVSQSISASLILSSSNGQQLSFDSNEIHHYGNNLHITAQGNGSDDGNIKFRTATDSDNTQLNDTNTRLYISASGNVGIGTPSPTASLEIRGGDLDLSTGSKTEYSQVVIASSDAQIDILSNDFGFWGSAINLVEASMSNNRTYHDVWSMARQTTKGSGDGSLRFNYGENNSQNNTNKVTIYQNGNTDIAGNLTAAGNISASGDLFVKGIALSSDTDYKTVMVDTASGQFYYTGSYGGGGGGGSTVYWETNGAGIKVIDNNHEVGIGGNPDSNYKLKVTGDMAATGDVIAYLSSDERLKDNIKPIENPIEKIKQIGGYTFDWNDNQSIYKGNDVGVIAQEIEKVLPSLVNDRDNGYKGVKYDKIVALLIEAVKDQQNQIDELKKLI